MKFCGVALFLLPGCVFAANSFSYNDDMACSYPFSSFTINEMSCQSKTFLYLEDEGSDRDGQREQNGNGECSFGDQADISGEVTIDEAVSRYFDIYLTVCFKGYYTSKSCSKFKTQLDLVDYSYQEADEQQQYEQQQQQYSNYNVQDGYDTRNSNQVDFMKSGTHSFKSRFQIPKKTFSFKSGSVVEVALSFHPKKSYLGPNYGGYTGTTSYNGLPYKSYQTDCYATLNAIVYDDDGNQYTYGSKKKYYSFSAGGAAVIILGAASLLNRKKRRLVLRSDASSGSGTESSFEMMSDVESKQHPIA